MLYYFPPHVNYVAAQLWEVGSLYFLKITKDAT